MGVERSYLSMPLRQSCRLSSSTCQAKPARSPQFGLRINPLSRSLSAAVDGTPPGYRRHVGSGSGGCGSGRPNTSRLPYRRVGVG